MARIWTIIGIILCVLIIVYLSIVARRAVDDELDDIPDTARDEEESRAFLTPDSDPHSGSMTEVPVPFRSQQLIPLSSVPVDRT